MLFIFFLWPKLSSYYLKSVESVPDVECNTKWRPMFSCQIFINRNLFPSAANSNIQWLRVQYILIDEDNFVSHYCLAPFIEQFLSLSFCVVCLTDIVAIWNDSIRCRPASNKENIRENYFRTNKSRFFVVV